MTGAKPSRLFKALCLVAPVLAWAGAVSQAQGQDSIGTSVSEAPQKQTLKQKSLDPTSDLKQLQFSNRFIPSTYDVDGYSNILTARIWYPIPKSRLFPVRQVMRATFPIITAPSGPTGLGDIRLFDLFVLGERDLGGGNWWRIGFGPVFVFPTGTSEVLGSRKWQVGPTVAAIFRAEKWQLALLLQNPISFAGNSDSLDVNRLIWQPILIYWLPKQWYVGLQGTPKSINWEHEADLTFPLSLRVGKVTTFGRRAVNVFVEPEYTAIHDENVPLPEWSIQIGLNFLFPL
jgi:hypothetical protein